MAAPSPRGRGGLARGLLLVLLPLSLLPLVIFAVLVYRQAQLDTTSQVTVQLAALATLKASQINDWADARAADADNLARSPDLAQLARDYPSNSGSARKELLAAVLFMP